jgi:hypothetical protein
MISIRVLAAVALAAGGLILSTPALAAPKGGTAVEPWANAVVLVKSKHRDRNWSTEDGTKHWRRDDGRGKGDRTRRSDRDWRRDGDRTRRSDRDWRRDGDRTRHSDRDWRRDHDRTRRSDRDWRRDDRRDHGKHYRRDRGKHYGWDRGKHYGWNKGKKRKHWRARHHPRHNYYIGRRFPRVQYVVIDRYDDYYLPPPRRGHYYARVDNDVYLVAEATKLIIDAFVLLDATGR